MLITRIITSILLILMVVLGIFFLPPLGFTLLSLLIIALAGFEYGNFFWSAEKLKVIIFLVIMLVLSCLIYFLSPYAMMVLGALWWIISPFFIWEYSQKRKNYFTSLTAQYLLGVLIFVPCFAGLVIIKQTFGTAYLFYLLVLIWATDIGAYFAGRYFGRHLMAPNISPKKTVEGLFGGFIAAVIIAIIAGLMFKIHGSQWLYMLRLALVTSLWSVIGDLFESMLKRMVKVKDSGKLLPGHGGVFDRIDSLTAAVPIFTLVVSLT